MLLGRKDPFFWLPSSPAGLRMLQHPRHTEKALALGRSALDKHQATITGDVPIRELAKRVARAVNLAPSSWFQPCFFNPILICGEDIYIYI